MRLLDERDSQGRTMWNPFGSDLPTVLGGFPFRDEQGGTGRGAEEEVSGGE